MTTKTPQELLITIRLSNDAFCDAPQHEVARILSELAYHFKENGLSDRALHDINGNTVGRSYLT